MKIGIPKVPQLQAGRGARPYGGEGARSVGQVRSGHWTLGIKGGGAAAPGFTRQGNAGPNSGWADKRKSAKKMF